MIYRPYDTQNKIVEIQLRTANSVYMLLQPFQENGNENIVFVDSENFISIWEGEHSSGTPESWRKDRKFLDAEVCFLQSNQYPVPPASIGDYVNKKFSFVDGITRTIWLLANGASFFPLLCSRRSKNVLEELAGLKTPYNNFLHPFPLSISSSRA